MPLAPDDPFAALGATTEEAEAPASKPGADPFAALGAEDEGSFVSRSVADPEFDPMGYALETGDHGTAKEIAWQKRSQPMTTKRFGGLVKRFGGAAVDMVKDFGGGLGAVAIDSAEALSTPDAPFWQKQGIDPETAQTIIERAKTQNLLRAQLAEERGSGFMSKIFGSNGFLAPAMRKLTKLSANASGDVTAEDAESAVDSMNKEEEDRKNNPRPYFDAKFDEALAHAKKAGEISQGQIQQDDLTAKGLKGLDYVTQRLTGAQPNDINPQLHFEDPQELAAANAPIDPEAIQKGAVAIDPVNLLPLHIPGAAPILNKAAGIGLRTAALPFRGAAWAAEHIPAVTKKFGSIGKYGLGVEAIAHPAYTAKALAGYAGTRVIGHVLDTAGQKLLNPKFVSAAERAAAEEVMDTGKRGFLSGAQNLADAERVAGRVVGGAAAAPTAMAPLNYAISDTPEEFASTEGGVAGFGGLAGGLGYHPLHGFRPETIQAVDSVLQEKGAAKSYGTDLDAAHNAYMANAPDWVKAGVNAYRGFFDGFRFADGKEPEIYVLPADQFAAEAAKDNPGITPELAAQQRGFKSGDGKVVVNGDYGQGGGTEAPSVLGHEAGGHVAQTIIQLLAPELDAAINKHATRNLLTDTGRPTAKLQRFIDAYNKAFDPTGQHVEIQSNEHAIQEFLAEQGRQAMEGGGPAKFAAGKALRETMQDNISDYFRKLFGTKHKFDRSEVPTLAREYRNMLFEMGRLRAMNEAYAPPVPEQDSQQAAAPGQPPAGPAAPAPAGPAAPPVAQAPGGANDRGAVMAALRQLGWPANMAHQMAAAAQGANVEEMIKDALARKQPTPLTPAPAPAPQVAPQNAVTGQLEGFAAPAGAPAAVAEAAKSDLSDFNPNETPSTPSAESPTSGTPGAPVNGPDSPATPGIEPVSAVSPDDISGALIQAEQEAQPKADRARSGATKAAIVRQARVDALSKLLPADGEGLKPVTHPETGEISFRGEVDPANPVHAAILNEFGYTPDHIASLLDLQAKKGQGVYLRDYNAAAQEGHETGEGLELTGEKRNKEYEASPTGDVGQRQGAVTKQDKAFTPYETVLTSKGVLIRGFDHDKFLSNLRSIVDAIKGLGGETPDYSDSEIADGFRKVAENHANGWKGDGSDQLQTFPDSGIKQNLDYVGQPVGKDLADIINMAMHIRSSRPPKPARGNTELAQKRYAAAADTAKEAQGLAQLNKGYLNPETGETNALRDMLEANGFDADKELKPTISNVRPDLIEGGIHDTPTHGRNVHAHGFDISPADLTASGTPRAKQTSAGFMPGDGIDESFHDWFNHDGDKPKTYEEVKDYFKSKGSEVIEADGKIVADGMVIDPDFEKIQPVSEWLGEASDREIDQMAETLGIESDFNRSFWEYPGTLYHATADDNVEGIDSGGLGASNKTRGLTNRGIGNAVFTSSDFEELLGHGSYGDKIYEIDTDAMKRDGYMPHVSQEPEVEEAELKGAVAHKLGVEDYEPYTSSDMSPTTVVIHGSIPSKYVKRSNFMPGEGELSDFSKPEDESSIKSKVANSPLSNFMPGEGGGKPLEDFDTDSLGFYSGLKQVIDKKIPNRASGDQILATLKGAGAKQEEMDAMGLPEYLKTRNGPITKQELTDFVKHGGVQLKEVQLSDTPGRVHDVEELMKQASADLEKALNAPEDEYSDEAVAHAVERRDALQNYLDNPGDPDHEEDDRLKDLFIEKGPKFENYSVPGGENYKEVLLTLPVNETSEDSEWNIFNKAGQNIGTAFGRTAEEAMSQLDSPDAVRAEYKVQGRNRTIRNQEIYHSNHWDEPNVLVHFRQADHTDLDGDKVRLIEEIQSDLHQAGRKRGYKTKDTSGALDRNMEIDKELNQIAKRAFPNHQIHPFDIAGILERNNQLGIQLGVGSDISRDELPAVAARARELMNEWNNIVHPAMKRDSVPDVPFKKTWAELAFKRALRMAVDDGMDKIAWVPGKMQIDRYEEELRKNVDEIHYEHGEDDDGNKTYDLSAQKDGTIVLHKDGLSESELTDLVGKDIAAKIVADQGKEFEQDGYRNWKKLEGDDLSIGGEGMKGFYDKILPDFVRKYVKKWGGTVESTYLPDVSGDSKPRTVQGNNRGLREVSEEEARQAHARGEDVFSGRQAQRGINYNALGEGDTDFQFKINKGGTGWYVRDAPEPDGIKVHSVTITPEMREAISKGQPMFMPGDQGGQLSGFSKEDMDRHAETAGAVYQGRQNDLHAFKELSTGGNYSLKDAEATPENIQGRADKVRESFKQDAPAITEDNLDEWLKANGFTGDKSKESEKPLSNFMPGGEEDKSNKVIEATNGSVLGQGYFMPGAYHGTPHKFDKFSMDKLGTGEGAQAFGWGLYFAENPKVAEEYRKRLSDYSTPGEYTWKGKTFESTEYKNPERHALSLAFHEGKATAVRIAKQGLRDAKAGEPYAMEAGGEEYYNKMLETAEAIGSSKEIKFKQGNTYKVDLDVEDNQLLHHDKPLKDQPEEVVDIVREMLKRDGFLRPNDNGHRQLTSAWKAWLMANGGFAGKDSGEAIYSAIAKEQGGEKEASMLLNEKGIHGIKYADEGSRTKRSGKTFNYVMFDDTKIKVTDRNGKPVAIHDAEPGQATPTNFMPGDGQLEDDYNKAIEEGDEDASKAILDKAAESKGYNQRGYHQTSPEAKVDIYKEGFRLDKPRARISDEQVPDAFFFKSDPKDIQVGSRDNPQQIPVYLKMENPKLLNDRAEMERYMSKNDGYKNVIRDLKDADRTYSKQFDDVWNDRENQEYHDRRDTLGKILEEWSAKTDAFRAKAREIIRKQLLDDGHDGVWMFRDAGTAGRVTDSKIVFDPEQIKSADPVTYDDDGEPIPLSKRFNSSTKNIRFMPGENGVSEPDRQYQLALLPRDMREDLFNNHAVQMDNEATEKDFYKKRVPSGWIDLNGVVVSKLSDKSVEPYVKDFVKLPPIVIADGKLIDGQHRITAARKKGVKRLRYIDVTGLIDTDPDAGGYISKLPGHMPGDAPKRTWFVRDGKRVYHQRNIDGKFAPKLTLAGADFPDIQSDQDKKPLAEFAP